MSNVVKKILEIKTVVKGMILSCLFFGINAVAKLPDVEDPSQGKQKGMLATLQAHVYDIVVVGGLLLFAVMLFVAGKNAITEYNNIGDGRGSWAKFTTLVLIGIVLAVLCIYLASKAADTLIN